jgi:hypothetical protein
MKSIQFPAECVPTVRKIIDVIQRVDAVAARNMANMLVPLNPSSVSLSFQNEGELGLFLAVLKEVPLVQPDSPSWVNPHSPPALIPQAA